MTVSIPNFAAYHICQEKKYLELTDSLTVSDTEPLRLVIHHTQAQSKGYTLSNPTLEVEMSGMDGGHRVYMKVIIHTSSGEVCCMILASMNS